jgi:hypothetical protein
MNRLTNDPLQLVSLPTYMQGSVRVAVLESQLDQSMRHPDEEKLYFEYDGQNRQELATACARTGGCTLVHGRARASVATNRHRAM